MIPDDLFWVVGGASGALGIGVLLLEIGDRGEPISGERVSIRVGWKGREIVIERSGDHCSFCGEGMLKGGRHRQVKRREGSGHDGGVFWGREMTASY